jgi:glycosyltransferase involved in cell wall biosynthesis
MDYRIPKRIIQTGKQQNQSLRNRSMMANIKLLNPDYEYLFFDDMQVESFIDREFPQYRSAFDSFNIRIQRYDFFRYLSIYRYGGFYFDMDVLLASGLSELLDLGCVFPFEGLTFSRFLRDKHKMDWEIGNYAFGAAPGHPFLRAIIENCVRAQQDPSWIKPMMRSLPPLSKTVFHVLNTTGPGLVSRTLAEHPELAAMVTVLFPDDVCDVANWNRFGELGVHLMEGTWRPQKNFIRRRAAQYWEAWKLERLLRESRRLGGVRHNGSTIKVEIRSEENPRTESERPLVSILIPAYNAQRWIADTLRSAVAQTWPRKEIIVVDDGSTDRTVEIARQFEFDGVRVVPQKHQGAAAARNLAFSLCKGDYIQWLDADDLLSPDKITRQMEVLEQLGDKRVVVSSAWGRFLYRYHRADFAPTALWCDLTPTEWLLRKIGQNLFMQTATWLVSRELTEAVGPWDTRLLGDDDGEYFCRILLACSGERFVPESKVYFRALGYGSLSYVGSSDSRCEALWCSMKLHIAYLRALEDSPRVREACIRYLQMSLNHFYPERTEIMDEIQEFARQLGGELEVPALSWKYAWFKAIFGWTAAKRLSLRLRKIRWWMEQLWDKTVFRLENREGSKTRRREIDAVWQSASSAAPAWRSKSNERADAYSATK